MAGTVDHHGARLAKVSCSNPCQIRREHIVKKLLIAASLSVAALAACDKPAPPAPPPPPPAPAMAPAPAPEATPPAAAPGAMAPADASKDAKK
jgi:hypothetical protein